MNTKGIASIIISVVAGSLTTALVFPTLSASEANPVFGLPANSTEMVQNQPRPWFPRMRRGWQGISGEQVEQHFITRMIPHHEAAVAMAELALDRSERPEIRRLARTIKTEQTREIEAMRAWYEQEYGIDISEWGRRDRSFGRWDRGYGGCPNCGGAWGGGYGAMMGVDWVALENTENFDRVFIEQMIPHHQMGVMMATMVANRGADSQVRELAREMIAHQNREIDLMQAWYQDWFRSSI